MAPVDPQNESVPTRAPWIPQATGAFLLLVVVLAYTVALRDGRWPPSHPWSGIALTLLAAGQLMTPSTSRGSRLPPAMRFVPQVLAVVAGLLWLSAAILAGH